MAMTAKEKKELEAQAAKAVSMNPEEMTEGGGLLDNIRAVIIDAKFLVSDYGGKAQMKKPCAQFVLEETVNGEKVTHDDQYWSCGNLEDWMPSDDGKYLIPIGSKRAVNLSSNLGMLMKSLLDNGYPGDKFSADITSFIGLEALFQQKVAEGRDKVKSKKGGKEYDPTVLVTAEIFKFPWEKSAGAKSAGAGGGKKTASAAGKKTPDTTESAADGGASGASGETGDVGEIAQGMILEALAEAGGEMPKKDIPKVLMMKAKEAKLGQAVTNQVMKTAFDDGFLGADDNPWSYADGVLSMG